MLSGKVYSNGELLKILFESERETSQEELIREMEDRYRAASFVRSSVRHFGKVLTQKERETNRMRIPLYLKSAEGR